LGNPGGMFKGVQVPVGDHFRDDFQDVMQYDIALPADLFFRCKPYANLFGQQNIVFFQLILTLLDFGNGVSGKTDDQENKNGAAE